MENNALRTLASLYCKPTGDWDIELIQYCSKRSRLDCFVDDVIKLDWIVIYDDAIGSSSSHSVTTYPSILYRKHTSVYEFCRLLLVYAKVESDHREEPKKWYQLWK